MVTQLWNEAVNGDFSEFSPTALGSISAGSNLITGALPESPSADSRDWFSFRVPEGFTVSAIVVNTLDITGFAGFNLALFSDTLSVLGSGAARSFNAGDNLLGNGFPGSLTAGDYSLDLRAAGSAFGANAYEFNLVVSPANTAPTAVSLLNATTSLPENALISSNILLADLAITDDGQGTNTLALTGQDASLFVIDQGKLFLKAGTSLDFETKNSYNISVTVDDPAVGNSPDAATNYTLTLTDVNEAPAIALSANTVAENAAGAVIGTLTVTDPDTSTAFRNNTLAVTDARFEVVNSQLKLKDGVALDYEAIPNGQLNLTLTATDAGNTTLTKSQALVLNVTDLVENTAPTAVGETVSTSQSTSITVELGDNVSDAEGLTGATLAVSSTSNGTIASIDQDARLITFTPTAGFSGTASFNYTLTDAGGLTSNAATVTVEVGTIQSTGNKDQDIAGNEGNDTISAGNGKDILRGFGGKDTLLGNNGNDTFYGGNGEDLLTGGNGADIFVLAKGEGKDTITDFKAGTDLIGLSGSLSFSALSFSGNNILNGTEVLATLTGVNTSTLTQSNFVSV